MKLLTGILHIIDLTNEWIGKIFSLLILGLLALVTEEVFARYFFKNPHTWGLELSEFLLLIIVTMGGGYTLLHGGHVKVDILYAKFSVRTKAILDVLTHIIVLALAYVLIAYGGKSFIRAFTSQAESFGGWQIITWPFRLLIPIAGVLLGLQALAKWIRDLATAITGEKLESKVVSGEGGIFVSDAKEEE